jgi:hypothetical protein
MRKRRVEGAVAVAVSVCVLATYGCGATSYVPRSDGHIAITSSGGGLQLTKNGTSVGLNPDTLQQAVAGNPVATEHARQAASDLHTGLFLNLGSLGVMVAGVLVAVPGKNADGTTRPASDERVAISLALFAGAVAMLVGSTTYLTSAQAHQLDAINIYNDGLAPPSWAPPPRLVSPVPLAPPAPVAPPEPGPTVIPAPAP